MSKIKNGGLDQYGAEPFEQLQSGTAGAEEVKYFHSFRRCKGETGEQMNARTTRNHNASGTYRLLQITIIMIEWETVNCAGRRHWGLIVLACRVTACGIL